MPSLLITPGVAGLVKADIKPRFYRDGIMDSSVVSEIGFTAVGTELVNYKIDDLPPDDHVTQFILTYEYPEGVGFYYVYGGRRVPPSLVIPIREGGLVKSDLSLSIYQNEAERTDLYSSLAAVEIGFPGDYLISGWPINEPGRWLLVWGRNGITFNYGWLVPDPTAFYLGIRSLQSPFEMTADAADRVMWSVNFVAKSRGVVENFERDIQSILASFTLSTLGGSSNDTYIGRRVSIGDGPGPYINIINTGGSFTDIYHNGARQENLTCQIVVRAKDSSLARDRIMAVWHVLDGRFNNLNAG